MPVRAPAKMTITAYSDPGFSTQVGQPFGVWINPSSYSRTTHVRYNDRQAQGSAGPSPEFNRVAAEQISFELIFDATGVIPAPTGQSYSNGVSDAIGQLITLTATLNGASHSPNYLVLSWGQLQFQCVLTSLDVNYTLFMPDGTPLRAKVNVSFQSYTSETQLAKEANKRSPDVTHVVTFTQGDTLPLLCYRIYGDSRFYPQVAAVNGLLSFRQLRPGDQLVFPPLSGSN